MTYIRTYTGLDFHYIGGDPNEVCLEDIAVALSRQPRFCGHTDSYLSVAQHSVFVSTLVQRKGGSEHEQMVGLLHDATEAYMCDIPRPLKVLLPEYKELERGVWDKICRHFFGEPVEISPLIKECDQEALEVEREHFCGAPHVTSPIWPFDEEDAYQSFIYRYKEIKSGKLQNAGGEGSRKRVCELSPRPSSVYPGYGGDAGQS